MASHSRANVERLAALDRLASAGDQQAEGEARRLRHWMIERDQQDSKRQDDRMKILAGAAVLEVLKGGRPVSLPDHQALLDLLDQFLIRTSDREAVLGDGGGSEALRRVLGLPHTDGLPGSSEADQGGEAKIAPHPDQPDGHSGGHDAAQDDED